MAIGLFLFSIVIEIVIICCRGFARKVPTNYILLFIFTACQAFYFSMFTSFYEPDDVLMAAGMTVGMTVALTIYACVTKTDLTTCYTLFFCIAVGMLLLMLFSLFMTFASWWHPVISAILVIVYGLYLVYDT